MAITPTTIETNLTPLDLANAEQGLNVGDTPSTNTPNVINQNPNIVPAGGGSIVQGFLKSQDYNTGNSGWKIDGNGDVEFHDGTFRGTITATSGTIGGFTITATTMYGGIIKTAATVGAGTTGVIMDTAGLRGYDSVLGLTFNLPTDGSAPSFSSGTISQTIFEINTNAVLRTSATVGDGTAASAGILINNTGLYACEANQTLVNANLKALINGDIVMSGTIYASAGELSGMTIFNTLTMGSAATDGIIQSYGWNGTANGYRLLGGATPSFTLIGGTLTGSTVNLTSGLLKFYDGAYLRMRIYTDSSNAYFQMFDNAVASAGNIYLDMNRLGTPAEVDKYSESYQDSHFDIYTDWPSGGQTFTTGTQYLVLTSCKFYIKKASSALSGNMRAKLYALTGTPGSTAVPTGSALATSADVAASVLTTSYALVTFTFTDAYEMSASTSYGIAFEVDDAFGAVCELGNDNSSPTHSGNSFLNTGSWSAGTQDVCFYVYASENIPLAWRSALNDLGTSSAYWGRGYIRELFLGVSTTGRSSIHMPTGAEPTSPADGDIWNINNKGLRFNDGTESHDIVMSNRGTGGSGSAGAGNQYVEMEIDGNRYKILHDGTV